MGPRVLTNAGTATLQIANRPGSDFLSLALGITVTSSITVAGKEYSSLTPRFFG
jgi:hypothetical protein